MASSIDTLRLYEMNPDDCIDVSEKGRILIATHVPPSSGGGVERFVSVLSEMLTRDGWEVRVASTAKGHPLYSIIRPLAAWAIGRDIKSNLKDNDLTICNNYFSWNLPVANSIVIYHGTEFGRAVSTRKVYSRIRNLIVKTVNSRVDKMVGRGRVVIAVSKSTRDEVEEYYGVQVDHVIKNAVDTSTYIPAQDKRPLREKLALPIDEFLVLFIGANDVRKGSRLLENFIIPSLIDEQHFVMAGRGSKPMPGVTSFGEVPFERMNEVYMACDAFVMPSYYEGCSLSTLEALSCGIPSIVSPTGLGKDLMTNKVLGRYVIPCDEPQRYVECLRELQRSQEEWQRVSDESRKYAVEHHDIERFRSDYLRVIEEVSARPASCRTSTSHDQ